MTGNTSNKSLNLHLGCGNVRLDGFINIDIVKTPAVDKVMDARKLDYPDGSVDTIYTSHLLEHFPHGEVPLVLKEWHRVLKPAGKAIIVTPDFDRYVDWYIFRNPLRSFFYPIFKYLFRFKNIESGREITDNFVADVAGGALFPEIDRNYETYHKVIYNSQSFRKLARISGFKRIEKINLESNDFPIPGVNPKTLHWSSMAFSLYK